MKEQKIRMVYLYLGIFIGIVAGLIIAWIMIHTSLTTLINNILPNIQIESINFNINETALVEAMNNTFGGEIRNE